MSVAPVLLKCRLKANPDGSLRTANPFGDFNPAPATLAIDKAAFSAALGSLVGLITGATAINFNARGAWLTGTYASACTFAVVTVSGSNAGSHNWSFSGSNLQQSLVVGSIGSGTLEIQAIDLGGHILSLGIFSWSIAATAGGTDILAPTIPLRLTITGATGALNCTIDPSADNYDGAIAPSGLDHYEVFLDGAFNKNVAAVKNPATQLVVTNIGAISSPGAPTATQSAGVWTLTCAGTGTHNTPTEQCVFVGAALAGDCSITVQADAFTNANSFATSGIMIRESLAQGAIFASIYVQPSAQALGIQVKRRLNTDGNGTNIASVNAITNGWLRLTRSGTNVTASYSVNGNTWSDLAVIPLPMASTAYLGLFSSSQTAGTNCVSTLREVNINTAPAVSFSVTTSGTHTLSVRAVDVLANASAQCAGVSGTAVAPLSTGAIEVHGGLYPILDHNQGTDTRIARATYFSQFAEVTGVQDVTFWAKWENPDVPGDYSGNWDSTGNSGFKYVDKCLAAGVAARPANPLRWMFHLSTYGFSGTNRPASFPSGFMPRYLAGSQFGTTDASRGLFGGAWTNCYASGITVAAFCRFWDPATMDRLIALIRAFGARYNNPNPSLNAPNSQYVVMMSWIGESAVPTVTGYTDAAAIAQYKRYFVAARAAWPTKELRLWPNYLQNAALWKDLLDAAAASNFAIGGPDCVNETGTNPRAFWCDRVWRGINPSTGTTDPNYPNRVGTTSWICEFEGDEMGPRGGGFGPATFGTNNWTDYIAHGNDQGGNYITLQDQGYEGNNDKRTTTSPAGLHPDAVDFMRSVVTTGGNVNGAVSGITLLKKDVYPSAYP